ncbi:MAG: DUF3341 domain-containing protein [candidate division Zixibacteria bacterium]|nr:DUF3341 domain-containing protein [candidate division Zixibacteria bacterium]
MNNNSIKTVGIMAQFSNPGELMKAAEKLRDSGYSKFDCHSPFPIHGMDKAMGLSSSSLGWVVGLAAIIGTTGALGLQWWTSTIDYPLVISGKPLFSFQAYVPITFAVGVLLSGVAALIGMLALNGLPRWNHPVFNSDKFEKVTDDAFFISIEAEDPKFHTDETIQFFESIGGTNCELLQENQ